MKLVESHKITYQKVKIDIPKILNNSIFYSKTIFSSFYSRKSHLHRIIGFCQSNLQSMTTNVVYYDMYFIIAICKIYKWMSIFFKFLVFLDGILNACDWFYNLNKLRNIHPLELPNILCGLKTLKAGRAKTCFKFLSSLINHENNLVR